MAMAIVVAVGGLPARAEGPSPEAAEFFEARIRPILVEKCARCHGARKQSSGLRLDGREAMIKGGDQGPAIVPGKPEASLAIRAITYRDDDLKMPPKQKLSDAEVAMLSQWVAMGAPWPASRIITADDSDPVAQHWAFRPVRPTPPPKVRNSAWVATSVDAYILARLEAKGIAPSPEADRRTLIRRATLDLWGLPPTAEEVDAFLADTAPDAYPRLIDRLLASPRYGERWGRHWLDVARYADTKGYVFTQERRYPYSFTYRDYVIDAFNADLPYDRFLVEQIAADRLPMAEGLAKDTRPLAALGLLTVGRRFLLDQNEIIDDRIDVVSRGLLGLTVTCARCHDHKFDPIPSDDYYALHGVFSSSVEPGELPVIQWPGSNTSPRAAAFLKKLATAEKARDDYLAARRAEVESDLQGRFSHYLKAAHDLKFDGRNPKLDDRARAEGLEPRRLRGFSFLWPRFLESSETDRNPVWRSWKAFSAIPADRFAANAGEVRRKLLADPKGAPVHPLVVREVLATDPKSLDDLVGRYVALFDRLETNLKARPAKPLGEADWESLRLAIQGPGSPLSLRDVTDPRRLLLNQRQGQELAKLQGAIDRLNATDPDGPARAMVMVDAPKPVEPHVFIRGNPGRPGKQVPRRFLTALSGPKPAPFRDGSGRLELARAIADPKNPLTARVLVNRLWAWHLGKGLVDTPSDFGLRSDPPTHPELLDHLASSFVAEGWSIKALHRRIMLSNTYRQSSVPRPEAQAIDPENRLVWRFNPQRLDFESMRDAILAVSGALDPTLGGRPVTITEPPFSPRRTVYGFIDRQNLDGLYRTFDFAVPDATSPRRFVTTVPQQALFLMNSPFLHEQARRLAAEARPDDSSDPSQGIRRLYRRVLLRSPEPEELAMADGFLHRLSAAPDGWKQPATGPAGGLTPWEQLAQVLLLTNEFMFEE